MPWRNDTRPYYVLVSELMLQQTQVDRVVPKFEAFIGRFPNESALASASLAEVLTMWQGLGYNRRAKYLHAAAKMIAERMDGIFPSSVEELIALPGVGRNTAGALMAYAYNRPVLYVETNVRTVYFHHFFSSFDTVEDKEVLDILARTIDKDNPRRFYWAVMDYGSWLKRQGVKNVAQSKHYTKQSKLEGSLRQVRGQIVKALTDTALSPVELEQLLFADERFDRALNDLVREGLVQCAGGKLQLAD